jgi:hypothetical protein
MREEGGWDSVSCLLTERGKMVAERPRCGGAPVMDGWRRWLRELHLDEDSLLDLLMRKRSQ